VENFPRPTGKLFPGYPFAYRELDSLELDRSTLGGTFSFYVTNLLVDPPLSDGTLRSHAAALRSREILRRIDKEQVKRAFFGNPMLPERNSWKVLSQALAGLYIHSRVVGPSISVDAGSLSRARQLLTQVALQKDTGVGDDQLARSLAKVALCTYYLGGEASPTTVPKFDSSSSWDSRAAVAYARYKEIERLWMQNNQNGARSSAKDFLVGFRDFESWGMYDVVLKISTSK